MDRTTWTDERIDDLVDRLDRTMQEFREEMRRGFARVDADLAEVGVEIAGIHRQMTTAALGLCGAFFAALIGVVIAAAL